MILKNYLSSIDKLIRMLEYDAVSCDPALHQAKIVRTQLKTAVVQLHQAYNTLDYVGEGFGSLIEELDEDERLGFEMGASELIDKTMKPIAAVLGKTYRPILEEDEDDDDEDDE